MMSLKDYIFYRMYLIYIKNNDFGRATCILYFITFEFMFLFPFLALGMWLLEVNNTLSGIYIGLMILFLFLINFKRYHKKSTVKSILKKYKNNPYNKLIKDWMLYLIPFMMVFWFIGGSVFAMKLVELFSKT